MNESNQVKVDITADVSGLKKGTEEAKREIRALEKDVNQAGQAGKETAGHFQSMQTAVAAAGIAAVAAGAGVLMLAQREITLARAYADTAEQMANLSEKTGLSVEELSLMRLGAETANTSMYKLAAGMKMLSVKMFEANSGNRDAQALFRALNVEWADGTGKLRNTRDVMEDVSTRFSAMENGAGKTAIAVRLLGRAGEELIPYLNQGGDKLKSFRDEAEKLGLKIDGETAKAVKDLKDNMRTLELSSEAAAASLVGNVVPALVRVTEEMIRAKREGGGVIASLLAGARQGFAETFFDSPQEALAGMLKLRDNILARITKLQSGIELAGGGANTVQLRRQIAGAWQRVNELQEQIMRAQGRVDLENPDYFGARPGKKPPPDAVNNDGKAGRAGKPEMTFDELLAKNAAKREQMLQQAEDEATKKYVREAEQRTRGEEREADAVEKLTRRYKDMIDPIEPLRRQLGELDKLYAAGKLTADEYTEATFMIQGKIEDLNQKAKDAVKDGLPELKSAIEGWGRGVSRELGQAAVNGELSLNRLGDAFHNLAAEIAAIQIQRRFMDPIIRSATGFLDGFFGGGGGSSSPDAGDFMINDGAMVAHSGGIGGVDTFPRRYIHPAYFERAPRFHSGRLPGLAPDELAAVIKKEEGVFTPAQMQRLAPVGSAAPQNIRVEIINQGAPQEIVSAQPAFDAEGMIVRVVTRQLLQGGPIRAAIKSMNHPVQ